jgi:hypothetical protein
MAGSWSGTQQHNDYTDSSGNQKISQHEVYTDAHGFMQVDSTHDNGKESQTVTQYEVYDDDQGGVLQVYTSSKDGKESQTVRYTDKDGKVTEETTDFGTGGGGASASMPVDGGGGGGGSYKSSTVKPMPTATTPGKGGAPYTNPNPEKTSGSGTLAIQPATSGGVIRRDPTNSGVVDPPKDGGTTSTTANPKVLGTPTVGNTSGNVDPKPEASRTVVPSAAPSPTGAGGLAVPRR